MPINSTFTLQTVLDTVKPFVYNLPLTITEDGQPFLGICNMVAQFMTAPPFKWRWNRSNINFVAVSGVQDYAYLPNWSAGLSVNLGDKIIDSNGNGELATTAGTTGVVTPTWPTSPNIGLYQTVTDNTIIWQQIGPLGSIPTKIINFGNATSCSVYDVSTNAVSTIKGFVQIDFKADLQPDSVQARPRNFSAQYDNLNGGITIRFIPVPDKAYPINISYQRAFVPFTSLSEIWSIPDDMFYVYTQGVLAMVYQYANDPRYALSNGKFISGVLSYQDALSDFEKSIFLNNWNNLTNYEAMRMQQGVQANAT